MNGQNTQERDWQRLKEQYLKQVEDVLSNCSQANIEEILAGVRSHLDRRYSELPPEQRTWENFQKIITEMGPPSDYVELAGEKQEPARKGISIGFIVSLAILLVALTAGLILLPLLLPKSSVPTLSDKIKSAVTPEQPSNDKKISAAIESAKAWLQLVDGGDYSQSWTQAAGYLKKFVNEGQWKTSLGPVRKPLGKVLSRKVINSTYATSLPGAPDGQYVVIQFETSFENKHNAIETVTPMMESDGQWHVSGYYIK
jgi:hypothetical protein